LYIKEHTMRHSSGSGLNYLFQLMDEAGNYLVDAAGNYLIG
jgi:hypothetical protein